MSILTGMSINVVSPAFSGPRQKRWNVDEFERLRHQGWFDGVKPMLLAGEIIEMPVPGPLHDCGIGLVEAALRSIFTVNWWVRGQLPLVLNLWTDPMPDLAVVAGSPRDYVTAQPMTAALVVELADSSLAMDSDSKADLYAAASIEDYWVVDLNHRQLIVFRDPIGDAQHAAGFRYATILTLDAAASISPLAASVSAIRVSDLLP